MKEKENALLRYGSSCILLGGAAANLVLLVVGFFSMGQVISLRGIFAAAGGIAGPVMYIIGGIQQNKAANADESLDT